MTTFWLTAVPNNPALPPDDTAGGDIGAGVDFWDFMTDPSEWSGIAADLSVLQLYSNMIWYIPDSQQTQFYTWAAQNNIPLAFNSGVLTYDDPFITEVSTFLACGGSLSYIDMDEPYYIAGQEANSPYWSPQQVAVNAASVLNQVIPLAPNVKIVDEEPIPALTAPELASWCNAYQAAMGRPLDGLQLDVDWNYGTATWEPALIAAVDTLEACGVPPGIIIDAYESTDMGWCDDAIKYYIMCQELFGSTISVYTFQSWMPNPTYLLSDQNPGALTNVEYSAQFYDSVNSLYQSVLGRSPTLTESFAAVRALSSNIMTISQLEANLTSTGDGVPQTVLYDGQSQTAQILPGSVSAVTLTSNDETVVAGSELTIVNCPIAYANDDVVGNSTSTTFVEFSGAGDIYAGSAATYLSPPGLIQLGDMTDRVTFVLDSNETIAVSPSLTLAVLADGQDDVINMDWNTAAYALQTTGSLAADPPGAMISGNATTLLNLSGAGLVQPGSAISGVGTIALSPLTAGTPFQFLASDVNNETILDISGGDTISVANATQTIINDGSIAITVLASAADASANIVGQSGGATLDVTTVGTVTLGSEDSNLTVVVPSFTSLQMNGMKFATADLTSGNASVTIGAAGQTILAGPSDVVSDPSHLGFTMKGSSSALMGALIEGFNTLDAIDITNFSAPYSFFAASAAAGLAIVTLDQGLDPVFLNFAGTFSTSPFFVTSDGAGGTFLKCSGS